MERKNNVYDKRNVKLDEMLRDGYIPFLEGRPGRDFSITEDDVTNLIIALNTADSLNEFVKQV